ncbi:acylamino-acid-releasing enzyme-like isoform X1 [Grus americana]|uniref:acylamino-acid-releasing enzyme-like isoform X1 n=1 Tax=Grus americana TaxID=9117 RepID=UPI002407C75A|nr:acylamino-acid-releasing enzyme-like isoform X1 [Grus americana]
MASGTDRSTEAAGSPAACYRELRRFPAVTRAALCAAVGGQTFLLYTGSSARTRPRGSTAPCSAAARGGATSCWRCGAAAGAATVWTSRRWGSTGRSTWRVRPLPHVPCLQHRRGWHRQRPQCLPGAQLCLRQAGLRHPCTVPGPFACLAWSHSETRLLYVAEKSRPKPRPPCPWDVPGAAMPVEEDEDEEGEQFVYREDWGEALSTRSVPVLCALDLEGSSISVLEGVPEHLSPGQALWSPDDRGVVFVGWWHEPFRLGLTACSNRRSGIFHLDLASGCCELLSAEHGAAFSPRLSPDGRRLLYLEGGLGGPHRQCLRLCMLTWQTRQTVTVLDVVQEPTEAFAGIYAEVLPPRCWAADSRRAVLGTPQRSRTDLLLVDTEAATVTNLTAGSSKGSWELLTLQWDLLVATCSAPHHPPSLVVAVLPPAGQELPLCWVLVEDAPTVPGVTWKTLTVRPPCSGQSPTAHGTQAFEALLLSPPDGMAPHPLVVCPHGGPHAVFDARWRPSMAALCRLGLAVLLVNYRGSLGFGQAGISSLLSRVGEQDVADTQLAAEQALRSEPLDPRRLALLAGSHGAFIALHLLAREPERYRACALRSPVSNLPALLGTSDIPDWRYTSLGLPYSFERVPRAEEVATMLLRSPIAQAAQVRTPVLLCVGARDRRVSPTQALELYRVLRARGVPVRLLWYPEGGHTLAGVEMEADVFRNCARWLLRHLGQPPRDRTEGHRP